MLYVFRWLVWLKLIQPEQQKTQLPLIILAKKKIKTNSLQGHKKYIKIFELDVNNLRIQIKRQK